MRNLPSVELFVNFAMFRHKSTVVDRERSSIDSLLVHEVDQGVIEVVNVEEYTK